MNRKSLLPFLLVSLATLAASAFADTVVLTSGEKIEGKVTAETETEITVAAKISAGVTDERVIKRTEIASITKDAPDEIAWQSLKGAKLGRNSLPLASYDAVINPLKGFLGEFPKSKFAADAQKIAGAFAAEKKRVEAGEAKLDDKWLSQDEAQKERVEINALIAFNFMKDQAARDMTAALNTLDAIEKNYPGTRSYPDAVEYAQKMLPVLKAEVDRRAKTLADQKAEREKALAQLTGAQKTALQDEIQREQAVADAVVSAAEKQGVNWLPLNPATERSLQNLTSKITSEAQRLASLPVAKMRVSIQAADKAKALLEKKDVAGAETALAQANAEWPANELAARLQTELQSAKELAATPAPVAPEPVAEPPAETKPVPETAPAPAAPVADEVEKETPFLLTIGGAITVVVAIALIIAAYSVFKKIKRKANEILE